MGHIGTSRMMLQRWWLNGNSAVHCRDAIHRVSKAATAVNESSMQVHGDAMNRVSTMGGDDGWMSIRRFIVATVTGLP